MVAPTQQYLSGATSEEELVGGGKVMSLWDHLGELRTRIFRSLVAIVVLFFGGMAGSDYILRFLKLPLLNALPTNAANLYFTGPMDVFTVSMKVALLVALVLGCPVWIYQFWKFVEPALYPSEKKFVFPFIFVSVTLFFAGVAFCYFIVVPMTLTFFISTGIETAIPIITITDYVSMLTMLLVGFGLIFEAPVILVLLGLMDLIDAKMLAGNRRLVIVVTLVVAALLTPPDPISQMAMATPLYLMFEMSILVLRLLKGQPTKASSLEVAKT